MVKVGIDSARNFMHQHEIEFENPDDGKPDSLETKETSKHSCEDISLTDS